MISKLNTGLNNIMAFELTELITGQAYLSFRSGGTMNEVLDYLNDENLTPEKKETLRIKFQLWFCNEQDYDYEKQ